MFLNPDKAFSVFSDQGDLKQCDSALNAAFNSASSVSCGSEDGCVIMSHKKLKKLIVPESYHKVFYVCPTIGITYSGLQPDFKIQLEMAQILCQDYFDVYQKYPSVELFINEYSLKIQEFGQKSSGSRPFGTFLIIVGKSSTSISKKNLTINRGACYQLDPSGSFRKSNIITSGIEYINTKKFISKRIGCLDDNIVTCLNSLKEFSGSIIGPSDVSVGTYSCKTGLFKVYTVDEIKEVFDSLSTY